ncbi:hypothetical protein JAAARDRAFT_121424 [Jaapia argillacea MUCL 33604]|uniref:Peptidase S28 n=1 Tax=Jaapia argillacea MUCL 33604 TaxID=933084 RepID=A0A067QJ97_9AGAM|nr:hypothetical protein JAAARDRAFT_121424 [Jaapia argillacea MUCL 33604]
MLPLASLLLLVVASGLLSANAAPNRKLLHSMGPQGVNLWRLDAIQKSRPVSGLMVQDSPEIEMGAVSESDFREHWFTQPLDHFSKDTTDTFKQRYWINTRHYKPGSGGPVIVLDGGETSGEDRLPFLDTGIVEILAKATGGVGIVLEHRYYGESIPVANFSTDSLRWLNNAQSAEDSANFMRKVKFDGFDEDLTAPKTPWIYYGGSYAGARAAHMKILYPDIVFGAIASSGVTHAQIQYWEYMDTIRRAATPECSDHLVNSINTIDTILGIRKLKKPLKALFGLAGLKHDQDFASLLETPLGSWQAKNWDPEVGSTKFDEFCEALAKPPFGHHALRDLPFGDDSRMVRLPGGLTVDFAVLNYAKYIKENVVSRCPGDMSVEDCFGTFDDEKFQDISLDQEWRAWIFQVCTEWGYFQTAPPDQKYPTIVSRLLTLEYESKICTQAYPPGEHFVVPLMPNVTIVNELGDFDIAADRLAIIDGEVDPWRPATPHSEYASDREDTLLRPFKLIPNAVHHYDEYGLADIQNEPAEILKIHEEMIAFVQEWMEDWHAGRR